MKLTNAYRNLRVSGSLDAASISVGEKFTLPTEDGELGQIMIADGDGTVTWQSVSDLSLTTNDVTEGSNLYFTIERVDNRIVSLIQDGIGLNWTYNNASNAFTGNVTLAPFDTDDLNEGASNLYFTDIRVNNRVSNLIQDGTGITWIYDVNAGELTPTISLSAFNTGDLSEGSNLYFTVERAQDATAALIQDGIGISWIYRDIANTLTPTITLAPFDTDDLTEGETNLYFTGERVDDRVSTLVKDTATVTWRYSNNGNLPGTLEADAAAIVNIHKNGSFVAAYNTINFIEGSGINLNFTNDAANSKVDITITSTGSEIESGTMRAVLSSGLLIGDPDIIALNFLEGFTITESPNRQINIDIDLLLDELSDVVLTSPILDGDTLVYDSVSGIWTNSTGGGGGDIFIERSLPDLHTDISNNELVPGATYKITGVHRAHMIGTTPISALYDDGRDLGTTIFLKAISENELETFGSGVFYNPKYDKEVQGFGVWSNNAPSYKVDNIVFWGGYAWKNLNGNTGTDTDILNLDGEWEKLNYDDVNYNKVIDYIEYDIENDIITRRYDTVNEIDVSSVSVGLSSNPISLMQWGNDLYSYIDFSGGRPVNVTVGVGNIRVKHLSSVELINFKGGFVSQVTLDNQSRLNKVTFDNGSRLNKVTFDNGSSLTSVTFDNESYLNNVTFDNGSSLQFVTFDNESYLNNVTFDNGSYLDNVTLDSESSLNDVTLYMSSYLENVTLDNESSLNDVNINTGSRLINVTLDSESSLNDVTLYMSWLENVTLDNGSSLNDVNLNSLSYLENVILNGSKLNNVTFDNPFMRYNTFINFIADFSHQSYYTGNLNFSNIKFEGNGGITYAIPDISMSTIITDPDIPQKKVFGIDSTTIKIQYWDANQNDFVVADITD